jgi:hypothetical protein
MKRKKTRKPKTSRTAKAPVRRRAKSGATAKLSAKSKAAQPDMIDAMVTAGAVALKLPLDPAWRGGVKFNLGLILRLGALVDGFAFPDDTEPGPVFHA